MIATRRETKDVPLDARGADAASVYGQPYETAYGATVIPVTNARGLEVEPVGVFVIKRGVRAAGRRRRALIARIANRTSTLNYSRRSLPSTNCSNFSHSRTAAAYGGDGLVTESGSSTAATNLPSGLLVSSALSTVLSSE